MSVELTSKFSGIPAVDQLDAVGQLVLILTDVPGVGTVAFEIDGDSIATPPSGEETSEPVDRQQYVTWEE